MQTTFIYALFEGEIVRYIGKANNPKRRFAAHLRDNKISYKNSWLLSLKQNAITPTMEIVDEVPMSQWEFWEQHYISLYKSWGFPLVNMNEGGIGAGILSDEACLKISKCSKGKKISDEQKKIVGDAHRGQKLNEKQVSNFVNYWKGKKRSEEDRLKKSESQKNKPKSLESIKKMRASLTGRTLTAEHKAKISPLGRKHSEEIKAKIKSWVPTDEQRAKMSAARAEWHKRNKQVNNIF